MSIISAIGSILGGAAGGPIGAIGGSLVGGLLGNASANKAANAQLQATRETNAMNYKIWQEQQQYNSAVSQRKRLEEAGLNPYLMMDGGSAGTMQSAPTMQTPDLSALHAKAQITQNAVSNAIPSGLQALRDIVSTQRAQEETQSIKLQNDFAAMSLASRVAEAAARARGADAKASMEEIQKSILGRTQNYLVERERLDNNFRVAQTETQLTQVAVAELEKESARLRIGYLPQLLKLDLAERMSRLSLMRAQEGATKQETQESAARTIKSTFEAYGQKITNTYAARLAESTLRKISAETGMVMTEYGLGQRKLKDNVGYYLQSYGKGLYNVAGAFNQAASLGLKLPYLFK